MTSQTPQQHTAPGGRSVNPGQHPQLLYNSFGEQAITPQSNSALVEKYSNLINKGITTQSNAHKTGAGAILQQN